MGYRRAQATFPANAEENNIVKGRLNARKASNIIYLARSQQLFKNFWNTQVLFQDNTKDCPADKEPMHYSGEPSVMTKACSGVQHSYQ
jgi:hypothetical protein